MGALYAGFAGAEGDVLVSVAVKLANPDPYNLTEVDLTEQERIVSPWRNWRAVEAQCRPLAAALLD